MLGHFHLAIRADFEHGVAIYCLWSSIWTCIQENFFHNSIHKIIQYEVTFIGLDMVNETP